MADVHLSFDVDHLEQMKRPQLQTLCKKLGIKANSKTSQLISDLKEYKETYLAQQNEKIKTPVAKPKGNVQSPTASDGTETQEDSFKKEMMQHLENKVKETLKESKIPRLNTRAVTFTVTPKNSRSKEHVAFRKMDSIDVYLEKKRKRTESFYQNAKKAKTTATTARSIVAEMKASHNTPARKTPENKKAKTHDKSVTIAAKPFVFGHLKSPKVSGGFSFGSQKLKTPVSRMSFSVATKAKENKTPHDSRKSIAVTPFRFGADATVNSTTKCSPTSAKKKFDLQASLSKPLRYKPHKGKLSEFKFSTVESKIPVRTNKASDCNEKKVDIKNVKVTSRAERRQKEINKRTNRRKNAMFQRRGLVN
ncbi:nucleolar and spindle-associated protein 1-like [Actinia tenebrosa]|uniref:Nucleolar and spindle-associated protein 1-like n=1 Tax=Actinia tenebrosa TaxID=6105 RepID=A0A6P8IYX4_ACTTE|nr:nucleolar and spindle-associated protein 1-like [Actinia tenebrosa]